MSYCRDNGITSNVYMFRSLECIVCSNCNLNSGTNIFYSRRGAINHLVDHTKNGDLVPNYAFQRLNDEIKDYGDSL